MTSKYLTTLNLDPFLRNAIGVTRVFENMLDRCENVNTGNFPPYNIIQDGNDFVLEIALAGFKKENVGVRVEDGDLIVESLIPEEDENEPEVNYIHRGIATRHFSRRWTLADHMHVIDARMEDGILIICVKQELPEEEKPKYIDIR